MKKQFEPIRSFKGNVSNNIKDFTSREHMYSEQKHLRAYIQGKKYFNNGSRDEHGNLLYFKVEEKWS